MKGCATNTLADDGIKKTNTCFFLFRTENSKKACAQNHWKKNERGNRENITKCKKMNSKYQGVNKRGK